MKNVWIVSHYSAFPQKDGWAGLHIELAQNLANTSWDVHVVSASTSHPAGRQQLDAGENARMVELNGTRSMWVRSREYEGDGLSRVLNMLDFSRRVAMPGTLSQLPRPDVVIGRVVNPAAALAAWQLARRFEAPYVLEISDIWPDTLIELGKVTSTGLPARALRRLEHHLIERAAAVMSPMPGVGDYLRTKGHISTPFFWVPNGVDADQHLPKPSSRESAKEFIFMYVGGLGNANAVDTIITAFDMYVRQRKDAGARLRIVGSGPLREQLRSMASRLESGSQIDFVDRIHRDEIIEFEQTADVLVANMRDLNLYRYGVALQKLFDYLLSARPVIFASNALNDVVADAGAGISVRADDPVDISIAMHEMRQTPATQRRLWGEAGRQHVLEHYTYQKSAQKFLKMLETVTSV